jgi:hypothetical protein
MGNPRSTDAWMTVLMLQTRRRAVARTWTFFLPLAETVEEDTAELATEVGVGVERALPECVRCEDVRGDDEGAATGFLVPFPLNMVNGTLPGFSSVGERPVFGLLAECWEVAELMSARLPVGDEVGVECFRESFPPWGIGWDIPTEMDSASFSLSGMGPEDALCSDFKRKQLRHTVLRHCWGSKLKHSFFFWLVPVPAVPEVGRPAIPEISFQQTCE